MDYISIKKVSAKPGSGMGKPGMEITYQDGFTSWCPMAVFERDYMLVPETELAKVRTFASGLDKLVSLLEK